MISLVPPSIELARARRKPCLTRDAESSETPGSSVRTMFVGQRPVGRERIGAEDLQRQRGGALVVLAPVELRHRRLGPGGRPSSRPVSAASRAGA